MIDSDALSAFEVFARRLSFTHAAEELAISQPALHVKIKKLGKSLGVPLYRRRGRRLELTPAGLRVQAFARESLDRHHTFLDELHHGEDRRPVVLAAGEGAYLYLLGDAIRAFMSGDGAGRRTPLRLLTRDRDGAVDAVRSGEAHVAVAALEGAPDDVVTERWLDVPMVLAMPEDHPLAAQDRVELRRLEGETLIMPPTGRPHRTALERALLDAGVTWQGGVETAGWELILHFVRLGLGLAVVNGCCRMPPSVVARPLPELPGIPFFLLTRRGASHSPTVHRLLGRIREHRPQGS